jgi:hypothetical protein
MPTPRNNTDRQRQRIEAQFAYDEAVAGVAGIIMQFDAIGKRAALVASRLRAIPIRVADRATSEGSLFALTASDFEDISLPTILELTHALVEAREEMAGAETLARALGCNIQEQ